MDFSLRQDNFFPFEATGLSSRRFIDNDFLPFNKTFATSSTLNREPVESHNIFNDNTRFERRPMFVNSNRFERHHLLNDNNRFDRPAAGEIEHMHLFDIRRNYHLGGRNCFTVERFEWLRHLVSTSFRPCHPVEFECLLNPVRVLNRHGERMLFLCFDIRGFRFEELKVTLIKKDRCVVIEGVHKYHEEKKHELRREYTRKFFLNCDELRDVKVENFELNSYVNHLGLLCIECPLPKLTVEELHRLPTDFPNMEIIRHLMLWRMPFDFDCAYNWVNIAGQPINHLEFESLSEPLRVVDRHGHRVISLTFDVREFQPEELHVTLNKTERCIEIAGYHHIKLDHAHHEVIRNLVRKFYLNNELVKIDLNNCNLHWYVNRFGLLCIEMPVAKMSHEDLAKCPVATRNLFEGRHGCEANCDIKPISVKKI